MSCPEYAERIWAHADGEPAPEVAAHLRSCPACAQAFREAAELTGALRRGLARAKPADADLAALRGRIAAALPAPQRRFRFAASAAAALLLVGAAYLALSNGREVQAEVERCTAVRVEARVELLRTSTDARGGEVISFSAEEVGRLRFPATGAEWRIAPGSRVRVGRELELIEGSAELASPGSAGGTLIAGEIRLFSGSPFRAVRSGAGLGVTVSAGTVECSGDGPRRVLHAGEHRIGGFAEETEAASQRAYGEGLDLWQRENWAAAAAHFTSVIQQTKSPELAASAQFYLAAALGRNGQDKQAIEALEAFLARYPNDDRAAYCRFFVGVHLVRLGRKAEAIAAFEAVRKYPQSDLRDLAEGQIAALRNDAGGTEGWSAFLEASGRGDDPAQLAILEKLIGGSPEDPAVQSGDAAFQHWACLCRLGRKAEALERIDRFLVAYPTHSAVDYTLYFQASLLADLGRRAEALAALHRLEKEFPRSQLQPQATLLRQSMESR